MNVLTQLLIKQKIKLYTVVSFLVFFVIVKQCKLIFLQKIKLTFFKIKISVCVVCVPFCCRVCIQMLYIVSVSNISDLRSTVFSCPLFLQSLV